MLLWEQCASGFADDVMFSRNRANGSQSKTTRKFRCFVQFTRLLHQSDVTQRCSIEFARMAAPGAKSAVSLQPGRLSHHLRSSCYLNESFTSTIELSIRVARRSMAGMLGASRFGYLFTYYEAVTCFNSWRVDVYSAMSTQLMSSSRSSHK